MRVKARFLRQLSFMLCLHKPRYYSNYNPIAKHFQRQHQYHFGWKITFLKIPLIEPMTYSFLNLKIHFFTNVSFLTLLFCLQEQDYYWSELACLLAEFPLTATTLPYRVLGNFLTLKKQRPLQGALSSGYLLSGLQSLRRDAIFNQFSFLNPRRNISLFLLFLWACISYASF